jgi:ribosomal protein L20A (L18A)
VTILEILVILSIPLLILIGVYIFWISFIRDSSNIEESPGSVEKTESAVSNLSEDLDQLDHGEEIVESDIGKDSSIVSEMDELVEMVESCLEKFYKNLENDNRQEAINSLRRAVGASEKLRELSIKEEEASSKLDSDTGRLSAEIEENLEEVLEIRDGVAELDGEETRFEEMGERLYQQGVLDNRPSRGELEEIERILQEDWGILLEDLRDAEQIDKNLEELVQEKKRVLEEIDEAKEETLQIENSEGMDEKSRSYLRKIRKELSQTSERSEESLDQARGSESNLGQLSELVGSGLPSSSSKEAFSGPEISRRKFLGTLASTGVGLTKANDIGEYAAYEFFKTDRGDVKDKYDDASKSAIAKTISGDPINIMINHLDFTGKGCPREKRERIKTAINESFSTLGVKRSVELRNIEIKQKHLPADTTRKDFKQFLANTNNWVKIEDAIGNLNISEGGSIDINGYMIDYGEWNLRRAFSSDGRFFCDGGFPAESIDYVIVHEIGHCIGLPHPKAGENGKVMSYSPMRLIKGEMGNDPGFGEASRRYLDQVQNLYDRDH